MTASLNFRLRVGAEDRKDAGTGNVTRTRLLFDKIATEGRSAELKVKFPDGMRGLVLNLAHELDEEVKALTAFFTGSANGVRCDFFVDDAEEEFC